jgi:hypothetical protein
MAQSQGSLARISPYRCELKDNFKAAVLAHAKIRRGRFYATRSAVLQVVFKLLPLPTEILCT